MRTYTKGTSNTTEIFSTKPNLQTQLFRVNVTPASTFVTRINPKTLLSQCVKSELT